MKFKAAGVLGFAGLLAIIGIYWWLETSTRPAETAAPNTATAIVSSVPKSGPITSLKVTEPAVGAEGAGGVSAGASPTEEKPRPTVGDILAEPDDDYVRVAKKLLALTLDARVPMPEREEALAHALNLSAGNEAEVLAPLIKNPDLPDAFAETILSEALNRPLAYQADLYLAALAARKSPELQKTIREHLAFLTGGDDRGSNPADWQAAIKAAKASWPE